MPRENKDIEALPKFMTAIRIVKPGGPEVLKPEIKSLPNLQHDEVLIKVSAAGVNRPDVMQRMGKYPPPKGVTKIPGLEIAGTVIANSENIKTPKVGAKICALVAGGGYAEYCAVHKDLCLPIPEGFSMVEAAAIPETFFTVWDNIITRAKLRSEESILIHGGSGGIGTAAIQLANEYGAKIFATAGTDAKCSACRDLGAHHVINYHKQDFVDFIKAETCGNGVDIILDMVGGDYVGKNLNALAYRGRLVQIATQKGSKAEIPVHLIMMKQLIFTGSTLRARETKLKAIIADEVHREVWPHFENGKIRPQIFKTFDLLHASDAHRLMDSGSHIGKIVLTM